MSVENWSDSDRTRFPRSVLGRRISADDEDREYAHVSCYDLVTSGRRWR